MPEIAPFRAVRYTASGTEDLERRIAPPYDVISPTQREMFAARDSHNIVHLILPKVFPGDDAENTPYRRAGLAYRQWLQGGELARDAEPGLNVLHQQFQWDGQSYLRRGLLARLRLRPFSEGSVLPHERTLAGPKADRLQLFRATRANLSPIFALVDDRPSGSPTVESLVQPAIDRPPDMAARSEDNTENALWRVTDPAICAAVVAAVGPRKAFIADGHHRYESGLTYAREMDALQSSLRPDAPHHFILAYLCNLSDPGLLILPTHRLLHGLPGFDAADLVARAGPFFEVAPVREPLNTSAGLAAARARLREAGRHNPSFLLHTATHSWQFSLRAEVDLESMPDLPSLPDLRRLDVTVVHGLVLQRLLGLSPESQERQENLRYFKDAAEAVDAVATGVAQAALLLNPTGIDQVRAVAEAGEVMPQKSTFFFPKLPSGLVINPLDEERSPSSG